MHDELGSAITLQANIMKIFLDYSISFWDNTQQRAVNSLLIKLKVFNRYIILWRYNRNGIDFLKKKENIKKGFV